MANDGRADSIFRSVQEIGSFLADRIRHGAEQRANSAKPAEVVGPPRDTPAEARGAAGQPAPVDGSLGAALAPVADGLKSFLTAIPQVARLLWKLTTDPRVPLRHKLVLGGAAAYLVSPVDLVPDRVPGVGQIDDFAVVVTALDIVLNDTADEIVRAHWTGDPAILDGIRKVVSVASQLRGGKVRHWLTRAGA